MSFFKADLGCALQLSGDTALGGTRRAALWDTALKDMALKDTAHGDKEGTIDGSHVPQICVLLCAEVVPICAVLADCVGYSMWSACNKSI